MNRKRGGSIFIREVVSGLDGPADRMAATEAKVTRFRTGREASRGYSFKHRLSPR